MKTLDLILIAALLMVMLSACKGPRGDQGESGQTVVGPQGLPGQNGTNGVNGTNGQQGSTGPQGISGTPGQNGIDATPVTWVQFCPGTTTYPSKFVEGGFCIAGNVYAVYSANDGFLTYIPPGVYSSNAINSACTFTLLANCIVQ